MPFEPTDLLDFKHGLFKAREPMVVPKGSWPVMRNCKFINGRITKRKGYSDFASLGRVRGDETGVGTGGDTDGSTLTSLPLFPAALLDTTADTYAPTWTNVAPDNTAYAWTDAGDLTVGVIVESTPIDLVVVAGNRYNVTIHGMNNPRGVFTISDGVAQEAEVVYVPGTQFGGAAQPITGDVDGGGVNTWTPPATVAAAGEIDVTFAGAAGGTPFVTYDRIIGTVVYATGVWSVDYEIDEGSPPDYSWPAEAVDVAYQAVASNPVMGIYSFFTLAGVEYLIACDTTQSYLYSAGLDKFQNELGAFTGDDADFFHFCAFEDIVVINNRVDPPQKYTPGTPAIAEMGTNFDADTGPATNDIDSAWFCFRHKSRLVYLRTTEATVDYAQRARWTPVNSVEYAGGTGDEAQYFTDAPTSDRIIAAEMIGDSIVVVFDKSVWRLDYRGGSPYEAFEWIRLPAIEGTAAPRGIVSLGQSLLYRGHEGIKITDAVNVAASDQEIPDEVLKWNLDAEEYSQGIYVPSVHEALLTFADTGDTYADRALVAHLSADLRVQGYSIYDLPLHCFGQYRRGAVLSWDDAVEGLTVNEIEFTPNSLGKSAEFPTVLAGDRTGNIYEYADGDSDDGASVTMLLKTGRFNPYVDKRCHLGSVEIQVDTVTGGTVTVNLYSDFSSGPYKILTFDIEATGESSKVTRKLTVNSIQNYHTIEIQVASTGPFALDRLKIWTKPRGMMREIAAPTPNYERFPYTLPFALG